MAVNAPDIEKLRRFALLAALALIFYSAAGIRLNEGADARIFDIPFTISKPDYLPLALILTSIYGMLRYGYYALMLEDSPRVNRKKLLLKLRSQKKVIWEDYVTSKPPKKDIWGAYCLYCVSLSGEPIKDELILKAIAEQSPLVWRGFGAAYYTTQTLSNNLDDVGKEVTSIYKAYPKVGIYKIFGQIRSHSGPASLYHDALIVIPLPCRLAAFIEDIDYTSPIWVNLLALTIWGVAHHISQTLH